VIAFRPCFALCHEEGSSNEDGLILNSTRKLLVYADDVNLFYKDITFYQEKYRSFISC
jgi:hypothetical protein